MARRKKIPLPARIALGVSVLLGLAGLGLTVTALRPTDVARLSAEHPAFDDCSGRHPHGNLGCGLSEVGPPDECRKAVVTATRDEAVSFPSSIPEKGVARLKGTLSIPLGVEGRRPAAILIHGSGPNSRDEVVAGDLVSKLERPVKLFAELAAYLVRQGLLVLRWDKRVPQFYPEMPRSSARLYRWTDIEQDARDALAYLATRPEVDGARLVVVGHSEGRQIAPYVAHGNPRVAAVIMLAGPIDGFEQGLMGQLERLAKAREAQWIRSGRGRCASRRSRTPGASSGCATTTTPRRCASAAASPRPR